MLDPAELRRLHEAAKLERSGPMRVHHLDLVTYLLDHTSEIMEGLKDRERLEWILSSRNINICRFETREHGTGVKRYYNSRMHIDAAMKEGV